MDEFPCPELSVVSTYVAYASITRDLDASLSRVRQQPLVGRDSDYYLENIEKVKSIDDFLGNERLYRYAMKAFGLDDMAYAKAFMRKVLTEGVDASDSFANTLVDKRYKEFAETFNFARYGENTTIFSRAREGTVDRFVRQTLELDAGAQNEGVRLALYFTRKAGEVESIYGILADPALSKVVRTILALPDATAAIDIDRQAELLERRFDIEDLKDPDALAKLVNRFTSMWELTEGGQQVQVPSVAVLFSQPTEFGISTDVMLTMQKMKIG